MSIKEKIETIATKIYGADGVTYSPEAEKAIANIEKWDTKNILYVWQRTSSHSQMIRLS